MRTVKRGFLPVLVAFFLAAVTAFALPTMAGASDRGADRPDDTVVCLAIGHCPELPPPPACEYGSEVCVPDSPLPPECDAAGNCEVPPDEGCYAGPNGDCLPPWCDPSRPVEDCPVEPPHPPYCEDGAEVCIPPMPPWCDEAGNCEEPPRPPICEEGVESSEDCIELPPECWVVSDTGTIDCLPPWCDPDAAAKECPPEPPLPPICDETSSPADFCVPPPCDPAETNPKFCRPQPTDPIFCVMGWPSDEPMPECPSIYLPSICEPGSEPGDDGVVAPEEYRSEEDPTGDGGETSEDPLPCVDPPVYGCFEDESGHTLCVDPPPGCWEAEGRENLIACLGPTGPGDPEAFDDGSVKRNNKGKNARAKARARAKKAKAAKIKKAKKAKSKKSSARR